MYNDTIEGLEDKFRKIEEEFSLCIKESEKIYLKGLKAIKADTDANYPEDLRKIIEEYHKLLGEKITPKKQPKNSTK